MHLLRGRHSVELMAHLLFCGLALWMLVSSEKLLLSCCWKVRMRLRLNFGDGRLFKVIIVLRFWLVVIPSLLAWQLGVSGHWLQARLDFNVLEVVMDHGGLVWAAVRHITVVFLIMEDLMLFVIFADFSRNFCPHAFSSRCLFILLSCEWVTVCLLVITVLVLNVVYFPLVESPLQA